MVPAQSRARQRLVRESAPSAVPLSQRSENVPDLKDSGGSVETFRLETRPLPDAIGQSIHLSHSQRGHELPRRYAIHHGQRPPRECSHLHQLDFSTGGNNGAQPVAIRSHFPDARTVAIDLEEEALNNDRTLTPLRKRDSAPKSNFLSVRL